MTVVPFANAGCFHLSVPEFETTQRERQVEGIAKGQHLLHCALKLVELYPCRKPVTHHPPIV
jgi:hypothetical protein